MAGYVTSSVAVSTTIRDAVVWYTIHPSESDRREFKTIRFSELDRLHRQLTKEVRWFCGRLPKKTLRRKTTADFVESRRAAIEVYLRIAATHKLANASVAWAEFFSGCDILASVASEPPSPQLLAQRPDNARSDVSVAYRRDMFCGYPEPPRAPQSLPEPPILPRASQGSFPEPDGASQNIPLAKAAEAPKEESMEAGPLSMKSDADAEGEGSEDEADCLTITLREERNDALLTKRSQWKTANAAKKELEGNLNSGDQAIKIAETEAQTAAALETEAAARLRSHRLSLENLEANCASKKVHSREKHQKQTELAKRYEDKLALTFEAVKNAQTQLENARRECIESAAQAHSNLQAATASKVSAEAADNAARDGHLAMVVAMNALHEKANSCADEAQAAERELDACKLARKALIDESTQAEARCRKAESEAFAADAAIVSQVSDSARRNRAHEVEVRRAQEKAMNSAALRDMKTRGLLMGRDRDLHEPAENEASAAAEADVEIVAKANAAHAETRANDAPALAALKAVAMSAVKNKTKRDTIAAALASRVAESEVAGHTASAKHASAVASCKSFQSEFDIVKARVDVLNKSLPEYAAKVAAATANLAAVKAKGDEDRAPLRCAAEAAALWLANSKSELDSHIQALDEVHMAVAEAHEDAAEPREDTDLQGPDFNFLQKSSAARCADHDKNAQDAARACKAAATAVEAARRKLVAFALAFEKEEEHLCPQYSEFSAYSEEEEALESRAHGTVFYDAFYEQRVALEAVVKHLDHVLQEKEEANKAASAALAAAKQELQTIEENKKNAPRKVKPIEKLVREELAIVDAGLAIHQEQGSGILDAAKKKASDWSREKEELSADMHRAQLQIQVAEQDVVATEEVTKTLKAGEKAAMTNLKSQRIVRENVAKQSGELVD